MSILRRYTRFWLFAAIMVIVTTALSTRLAPAPAFLIGFDCGASVFLVLMLRRFVRDKAAAMRARAADNEPDHHTLIGIALVIALVTVVAVWVELTGHGARSGDDVALAGVSLVLAWLFANTLFTLHYAHVWYLGDAKGDLGGLDFPGDDTTPDYWDFAYFAFVLGMTFQVSDVDVTSKRMRRIALGHGLLAFLFNIAVVALSVNLVATAIAR
ncbi:DUF1345 domain-containing protein [Sandarakinorhabdus sp. DWP1-3-1]|uniref:DUF1345 domain-containing protein n=1 Tax=Sandarakinorhabdus sp. DWP1-3-1 TaxID=2804627 RepID=UPI003CFB1A99